MCKEAVSGYRAVAWRERKSGSRGRDGGGVGGGNLVCETVGIRKQETAGRGGGLSVTLSVLVKKTSHMCCNLHFLTDLNAIVCDGA